MAERVRLYERWWARATLAAVGAAALSACNPGGAPSGANYSPAEEGYTQMGELNCLQPAPNTLTAQYDFSNRYARAVIIFAQTKAGQERQSMRIKLLGPDSSVLATNEASGKVDIDQGTITADTPVEMKDIIPGVVVTATMPDRQRELIDINAVCEP